MSLQAGCLESGPKESKAPHLLGEVAGIDAAGQPLASPIGSFQNSKGFPIGSGKGDLKPYHQPHVGSSLGF